MLYQALPPIESDRLDRWERWLAPGLAVGAAATVAVLLLLTGRPALALIAILAGFAGAAFIRFRGSAPARAPSEPLVVGPDYALLGSALGLIRDPAALTTSEGSLLIVNPAYRERFGATRGPLALGRDQEALDGL